MNTEESLAAFVNVLRGMILGSTVAVPKVELRQACLRALFLTNLNDDRQELIYLKGLRVAGTCERIKSNALYKLWLVKI